MPRCRHSPAYSPQSLLEAIEIALSGKRKVVLCIRLTGDLSKTTGFLKGWDCPSVLPRNWKT